VFLEKNGPPFPYVALLASGGHTAIYLVTSHTDMNLLGQTRDDAAGEAYDKVAKMLGLGYPGGRIIDRLAESGDPKKIDFPRAYLDKKQYDFSFSGVKTAVSRYIQTHSETYENEISDIASGFQEAVVDVLCYKIVHAASETGCKHVALVGGVAANNRLRGRLIQEAKKRGLTTHIPSLDLCGDNAAMIAATGYHYRLMGKESTLTDDVYSRTKINRA